MNKILVNDFKIEESEDSLDSCLLIIQNKKKLYKVLMNLDSDFEDTPFIKIIDNSYKLLKNSDYIDYIPNLLLIDVNTKKNINALLRQIKVVSSGEIKKTCGKIVEELIDCFNNIKFESTFSLYEEIEFEDDDLLKLLSIKIEDNKLDILNRLITYIKISYELRNIKIFITFNIYSLLEDEEINLLIKETKLLGVKLINIETSDVHKNNFDIKKILDKDLCLIE